MPALTTHERKRLRRIGHELSPIVMIGNHGLSDGVIEELRRALADHELIKVKVAGEDRELRQTLIDSVVEVSGADVVQQVGKIILMFKKAEKRNVHLSNLVRFAHLDD
ncbi:ribosome assembly RNA-binding protein YhbY [Aquirhabdus sp.]|uniref:ribosome assembly RNA-binding protein YhbY n=1 Tax=Aquirhabdus sp. TaxID=2824160 RepID=UPI00396C6DD5